MDYIYTAISSQYDILKARPAFEKSKGAQLVAFMDEDVMSSDWEVRRMLSSSPDPKRRSQRYKVLTTDVLPDATHSLWVDGSIWFADGFDWEALKRKYLINCDIVTFKHRTRTCIYDEADECVRQGLDHPEIIQKQMLRYRKIGYPSNQGLAELGVILRRHTPSVLKMCNFWYDQLRNGSKREQLSFNYSAWMTGVKYQTFPGTVLDNPFFIRRPHNMSRGRSL